MAKSRSIEWAKRFLDDAKERQVNTIIAETGISGRAMPEAKAGLKDVANTYYHKLDMGGFFKGQNVDSEALKTGDAAAFETLADAAERADDALAANVNRSVYRRIASTSKQLREVAARVAQAEDGEVDPKDRAAIMKAWELGVSVVAMQTTVGLDGDLITRISKDYLGSSGAVVRQIHEESVRTSIGTWESLIKGILKLATAVID